MDLGRQCAYTRVWALPIEEYVGEPQVPRGHVIPLCKGFVVFTLLFYQMVYKGQTITMLGEKGSNSFSRFLSHLQLLDWYIAVVIICECSINDCWVIGNNNNNDRNEWLIDRNINLYSVSL